MHSRFRVFGVDLGCGKLQKNGDKSERGGSGHPLSLAHLRNAKVAQKYCAIRVQEDVLGLQIAVHHADRVQEFLPPVGDWRV